MEMSGQLHNPVALPLREKPRYPLDKRLDGPQSWTGHSDKEKKSHHCPYREFNMSCPAHSLVSILIELHQILRRVLTSE
jgi:hypothetical protein